jgi:hypothetical protein
MLMASAIDLVMADYARACPELQNEVCLGFWGQILMNQQRKW